MPGFFLLTLLLGAFVASCFGDILSGALRGAKDGGSSYQNCREAHASRTRRTLRGKRERGQGWNLEISSLHCKPTTGGTPLRDVIYQNRGLMGTSIFCPGAPLRPSTGYLTAACCVMICPRETALCCGKEERNHEQEAKLFPETIRFLGGFSRHDFFLAAWTSTLCGSRSSEKGSARIRSAFASRVDNDSALARPGHSQPRKVAVRETEKRAGARGHDRKWFLGAAPRSQRQQEYSFDGKIAGSQRPHG